MPATKPLLLALLLLASADAFGQARKAQPSVGLSIGGLNGATLPSDPPSLAGPSLPLSWPFKPRDLEAETFIIPPYIFPGARLAPRFNPAPTPTDPGELYYLLKTKSVEIPDGLIGLKFGSKLRKQPDGSYLFSGIKVTLPAGDVTNDPEVARKAGIPDVPLPAPLPSTTTTTAPEPGHARLGETPESFRRTPHLQWLGGSSYQLDTYSVIAVFWEGKCHELTFADLVQDTAPNRTLREDRRSSGQYDKFFAAVLKANAGDSEWIEQSEDTQKRKWRRADGAMKAEATNTPARSGVITLTTTDLTRHRLETAPGYKKVLEGL